MVSETCACNKPVSSKPTNYPELENKCARCRRRWHADGRRYTTIVSLAAGEVVEPEAWGRERGYSNDLVKHVLLGALKKRLLEPVYRTATHPEWTEQLTRFIGVPPSDISVAFRRMA